MACEGEISSNQGTIKAAENFDAEDAAQRLRKAMKGLGTDETQIISVLSEHNNEQRQRIKDTYKASFGRDLVTDLKSEIGGHFETLCLYLLMPAPCFDACCLKNAMARVGTKESHLIDIMVSRNNEQMEETKTEYKKLFQTDLEEDLMGEVSGDFRRVLIGLLQGLRKKEEEVDEEKAKEDMRELYNSGEGMRMGTDEDSFTRILVTRSVPHLRRVFEMYNDYAKKDIEDSLKSEFSGDTEKVFLSIARYIKDPIKFFARCFHESMKGIGTDDERLMQLTVSHAEVDLKDISKAYNKEYGCSLAKAIKSETSGDYKKLLITLATTGEEDDIKK